MAFENLLANPSFETNTVGWTGSRGTVARVSAPGAVVSGSGELRLTLDGTAGQAYAYSATDIAAVSEGETYTVSVHARRGSAFPDGPMQTRINWLDGSNTFISRTDGAPETINAGSWTRLSATGVAPVGAVRAQIIAIALWPNQAAGQIIRFDAAMINEGELIDYADGDTPNWVWDGTPHASTARRVIGAEPSADFNPVPLIRISLDGLATKYPTAKYVQITRTSQAGNPVVQGAWRLPVADFIIHDDVHAPFNTPVTYGIRLLDASGAQIAIVQTSVATLTYEGTVIQNSINPNRSVEGIPLQGAVDELTASFEGELVRPGLAAKPMWVGTGRNALQGVKFPFGLPTSVQDEALVDVFGRPGEQQTPVICIRTSLPMRLPQPFFAVVTEPRRQGIDWQFSGEWTRWELVCDEALPPGPGLVTPSLTWNDVAATYSTWTAVTTAQPTWAALMADTSIAGAADA